MLFLDKENFYKITSAIYHRNDNTLIFNCCEHFRWDANEQIAEEMIIEDEAGICYCSCCGEKQPKDSMLKIRELVTYINKGGRDDAIMTDYYKDVDLYEWGVIAPGRIVDNYAKCNFTSSNLKYSFGYDEMPICTEDDYEEEAAQIELGNDEGVDPGLFLYTFEHFLVVEHFFEDPVSFIESCLEKSKDETMGEDDKSAERPLSNYIFAMFYLATMLEDIEHNITSHDFEIKNSKVTSKYNLLTIGMPTPFIERLCYKMDILYEEGKEENARLFTLELGEDNTKFLCGWIMRDGRRTHLNYDIAPKDKEKYMNQIIKIYEGKRASQNDSKT